LDPYRYCYNGCRDEKFSLDGDEEGTEEPTIPPEPVSEVEPESMSFGFDLNSSVTSATDAPTDDGGNSTFDGSFTDAPASSAFFDGNFTDDDDKANETSATDDNPPWDGITGYFWNGTDYLYWNSTDLIWWNGTIPPQEDGLNDSTTAPADEVGSNGM
jgi:hypothetical protein